MARLAELYRQAQEELLTGELCHPDRDVWVGARATKNFFEESGFTARLLVMHRRLNVDG